MAWNASSRRLRWGLSGDMKKQRVHPSLWGKSLLSGRPRGTCAEFRVLNDALKLSGNFSFLKRKAREREPTVSGRAPMFFDMSQ